MLRQAFEALVATLSDRGIRYAIVGGLATHRNETDGDATANQTDIKDLLAAYAGQIDLDFIRAELDTFTEADDERRMTFEAWVDEMAEGR